MKICFQIIETEKTQKNNVFKVKTNIILSKNDLYFLFNKPKFVFNKMTNKEYFVYIIPKEKQKKIKPIII